MHPAISKGLKKRGHQVLMTSEAERSGLSDREHLEFAKTNNYVIVTADQDFLRLAAEDDVKHPGIIFLTHVEISPGKVIREIGKIVENFTSEDMKNHIEFIS